MKGILFDIQRFSVHDGPGIRTTVFMKGCPLRCRWCHNPEGLSSQIQLQFFEEKCIGCGTCQNQRFLENAAVCPGEAITVCGKEWEDRDVLREVLKDRLYYGQDGGITFSGGECLMQWEFVASVLGMAKVEGLHTAVDTAGFVPRQALEATLPVCDLYLYDVKCLNSKQHQAYTGVPNAQILENLRWLDRQGKAIWIRIPVIPDFNNSESEMTAIAEFVSSLSSVQQVTLMPYHSLGASKYPTLGLQYPYDSGKRITESEMANYRKLFENRDMTVV